MKRIAILLAAAVITVALNIMVVDNRDYPEDAHEVYLFGEMVGEYHLPTKKFRYLRTGKKL